jgi:hypothetical protein
MKSANTFPHYFSKIRSNIIHPSTPRSSEWFFPGDFPTKIFYALLISPMRAAYPSHLVLLDFIALIKYVCKTGGIYEINCRINFWATLATNFFLKE